MDKEQMAIARLRDAAETSGKHYGKPLIVTTSGGKDSSVCVELARRAGIEFELMHNHTTADAPETVRFVRAEFKRYEDMGFPSDRLHINYPVYKGKPTSMWSLIPQKLMPPTRLVRYCCEVLKEHGGRGRYITTGVRWAESESRKKNRGIYESKNTAKEKRIILNNDNDDKRRLTEHCMRQGSTVCNPIIDWTDDDVWNFLADAKVPVNPLYSCGFERVGCIGCPMAGQHGREREFLRYPGYEKLYVKTFDNMLAERQRRGKMKGTWNMGQTGMDVFHWWMEDGVLPGQMSLEDLGDAED